MPIYLFILCNSVRVTYKVYKNLCFECASRWVERLRCLDNLMDFNLSHALKFWHMHARATRSLQRGMSTGDWGNWVLSNWRTEELRNCLKCRPPWEGSAEMPKMRLGRRRKVFRVHMSIAEWYCTIVPLTNGNYAQPRPRPDQTRPGQTI